MSDKVSIGKHLPPMVMPVCLLGANVEGKANFTAIAWFTMIDDEPPTVCLVLGKNRRTMDGIKENGTFSVNLPSDRMAVPTDYCGIHSGSKVDKSRVFSVRYGRLGTAPLIDDCPVTAECSLAKVIEFEGTDMVIGEFEEVYVDPAVLVDGKPDVGGMSPLLYLSGGAQYVSAGQKVADAFKAGRSYRPAH